MLNTYRRHDAVFIICQKNETQKLEIAGLNQRAQNVTGYTAEDLTGQDIRELFSPELQDLLAERLTFSDGQDDLADALLKVRTLKLRIKNGTLQEFRVRVVRSEVIDNHSTFHLALEDERMIQESSQFKKVMEENFKGHEVIEERTGLRNRQSLIKDLELFQFFAKKRQTSACFAVMYLDNATQVAADMGAQVPFQILKHLGQLCKQRLRQEDLVGLLSPKALGILLMNITPESSRVVLNRLRWSAASMPVILDTGSRVDPEISIAFSMIAETMPEELIQNAEQWLENEKLESGVLHHLT